MGDGRRVSARPFFRVALAMGWPRGALIVALGSALEEAVAFETLAPSCAKTPTAGVECITEPHVS